MTISIRTTEGNLVTNKAADGKGKLTLEQAEASVKDRNQRAEEMGLETRYEVTED